MKIGGAGMKAIAVGVAAAGLAQCDRDRRPASAPTPEAPLIAPSTSLNREALVLALSRAASDHAAGRAAGDELAGRTFRIALAFACPGETLNATPGVPGLTPSEDGRRLLLSVTPADWTRSPLVLPTGATPAWERVEGLWITRPWMTVEGCPAMQAAPSAAVAEPVVAPPVAEGATAEPARLEPIIPLAPPPSPMTVGLAVVSDGQTSRLGRRAGEAWSHTIRGEADAPVAASAAGYRLVLSGRIGRFPEGGAVRCSSETPDTRPVCVAAVELDLVAFEDASGARLSEWRPA